MTCKGAGGKKAKYMYYFCDNCNLYYNEAEIEDCLIDFILDLVEYDFHVKKYFHPILAEKKDNETKEIEKEIKKLEQQKERIKKVYLSGIVKEEDFAEDYKLIEKKLADLENKRIDSLDFDKETYNPQNLLAERDIEREKLTEHQMYKDVLLKLWTMKSKEEKQSFISKFIETATLKKDKDGNFDIDKINFRSSFVEQIDKLYDKGVVDFPTMLERGGKLEDTRISVNMNNEQLQDYLSTLKKELDINYMDLGEYYFHDDKIDENYDNKSKVAMIRDRHIEFKLKKNQKVIRMVAKKTAKGNISGTTSFSNNAIQNANDLSRVNKHNLRDYDNQKELITTIYGTDNIVNDVKQLYLDEFEEARNEYNNKQTRNDRKIDDYYKKVCESQNDIACEIIIELGDMDFWQDKDDEYRFKMIDVYNEQIQDLVKILPTFKIASATIHFDETSPHMHVIGVPVIDNCKRGMKKQVGKLQLFTKTILSKIQDKMRNACIKSYNKFYDVDSRLKTKQKGRNQDINVKDMDGYKDFKKQLKRKEQKLAKANEQTEKLDNSSKDINRILDNLKPTLMNKNNMVISSEDVQEIKNFTKDVKDTNKTIRSVNDLNLAIKDFEYSAYEVEKENRSLKYQLEQKEETINRLTDTINDKDEIIDNLRADKEELKGQLHKFKEFWKKFIKAFSRNDWI